MNRSTEADKKAIPVLRGWLAIQPNAHAAMLSGRAHAGTTDEVSARELEALLLGRVASNEISRTTAAQYLYLMHRVGKRLRKLQLTLAPTWVSALLRPPPSPFPRETARSAAKVEIWRKALNDILEDALPKDAPRLWALTVLSAVCNGALLDQGKLIRLRLMIERECMCLEGVLGAGHAFVDFLMPYRGLGNHHLQRWWCDPVTELLLQRFPSEGPVCSFQETMELVRELLTGTGVAEEWLPTKMTDLLKSASTWWALRCAPVDLHVMSRTFASHSLTARCWARLLGKPPRREPGALANPGRGSTTAPPAEMDAENEMWLAAMSEHEWLEEVRIALTTKDLDEVREWAKALERDTPTSDYRYVYVGWLSAALAVPPRNKKIGIGLKALAAPFLLAAPRLLNYFGAEDPRELELSELDETYRVILDACEPGDPVERIARGLRLFHDHLVRAHKTKALPDPRATFGEGGALMPVDATLISVDEYLGSLDWLEQQLQLGADAAETHIGQVVLILTFRCGLRRGEVFGLRLCDIHDQAGIYLHVRRYPGHRLKTPNATRTIRIDALLTARERAILLGWIDKRISEASADLSTDGRQARLLARHGSPRDAASIDGTVRRVMQAVHAVTREPRLVLHHLRHSCASWLWLKLRAPDYPHLSSYLSSMPALCRELRQTRRLRIQLCGAIRGPVRSYSNVVSRLLGHGIPVTSLEHYIHVADLFLAATTLRAAARTPIAVWQSLTGASRSVVYAWLRSGPHGVVQGHRARVERAHGSSATRPEAGSPEPTPWRKRVAAPPLRFNKGGGMGTVSRVLHLYNRVGDCATRAVRVATVAQQCSLNERTVELWLDAARANASAFGMNAPAVACGEAFHPVPAPDVELHRATVHALNDLAERFDRAADAHPELLSEALEIAASRFNLRRHDVCFRGQRDEVAVRKFLKLLDVAGLVPDRCRLTVRRLDATDTRLPHWFRSARAHGMPVKRVPPPGTSRSQARAYARWVGVQLCGPDRGPEGHAWRIGLFLARVAYTLP
ncbi:MAG: hypothetical protein LCI02_23475 [Proteobacteria bacterium]|nr:hypothetical protein [Pseudomonadota bacterium]